MEKMSAAGNNDAELVAGSLAGQRDGFRQIVERYQSLICSLAYSATGSLSQSEDLAQETFVAAWKQLAELREPSKLRSWLCGIARNRIGKALRRDGREPIHTAEPLDAVPESAAPEPLPPEQAISREEEAILWRSLERIPNLYREPLILFYRERQSIERLAEELELSEDAVKQRLSRGRKLLTEEVSAFVEGALARTNPGKAFTLGVLASLPVFATSASAATLAASAAKGTVAAKAAISIGWAGAILGPIIGILGGWLGAKMSIENTESQRERQFMIKMARIYWVSTGVFCLAMLACMFAAHFWWKTHPVPVALGFIGMLVADGVTLAVFILWGNRVQGRIQAEEAAKLPPGISPPELGMSWPWKVPSRRLDYRSRWTLLGLPLVHVRLNCKQDGKELPAKGWIAIGGIAYGVLFACGAVAVAPVSIGGAFAVGLLSLGGGCAVGLLSFGGGFSLGAWALAGGLAAGILAAGGGCALGWTAAQAGGLAWAREFASGGLVLAPHADDVVAGTFIRENLFFQWVPWLDRLFVPAIVLVMVSFALLWWLWLRARRKTQKSL